MNHENLNKMTRLKNSKEFKPRKPTAKQKQLLKKLGINPKGFTRLQASRVIKEQFNN